MTVACSTLTARLAAWPFTPDARRPVGSWAGEPRLGRFSTAGAAAVAARSDGELFVVLAAREDDQAARLAALSVVAACLVAVVGRWARSGVPPAVLEDMDADLAAEVLSVMAERPEMAPRAMAGLAWRRVSGRRRTERARAARQVTLTESCSPAVASHRGRICLTGSAGLVVLAAVSGWSPVEASSRLGMTAGAWRARTSRARRVLRSELGVR